MVRRVIQNMMALALVPEQLVFSLFSGLDQNLTEIERTELSGLLKYFDDFWMHRIQLWNVFNIPNFIENYSEGTI